MIKQVAQQGFPSCYRQKSYTRKPFDLYYLPIISMAHYFLTHCSHFNVEYYLLICTLSMFYQLRLRTITKTYNDHVAGALNLAHIRSFVKRKPMRNTLSHTYAYKYMSNEYPSMKYDITHDRALLVHI